MIIGSKKEIKDLVNSQSRFVGSNFDVNGAIACVSLHSLFKLNLRNAGERIFGVDHTGKRNIFKIGPQCKWLWGGSRDRPKSWKDTICDSIESPINSLFVLCIFFKNNSNILDGNPFIGGTQDNGEDLKKTALRELREEVGLIVKENETMHEIPTVSHYKRIWLVEASSVIDSGEMPISLDK